MQQPPSFDPTVPALGGELAPDGGPALFELAGPEAAARGLSSAAAALREAERVRTALADAEQALEDLDARIGAARSRLADERQDVRELQTFTLRGVLSDLRGRRERELEREGAEAEAAHYRVAQLEDKQGTLVRARERLLDRLAALGDVEAAYDAAAAEQQRWVEAAGGADADALASVVDAIGRADDERLECEEGRVAADLAIAHLERVAALLGEPESWAAYDTWRGEVFGAAERDDRLEDLGAALHGAEGALRSLSKELGDVEPGLGDTVPVERWERAFEPFFDDLGSERPFVARVQDAIVVDSVLHARVAQVRSAVEERLGAVVRRAEVLDADRRRLLAPTPPTQM